MTTKYSRNESGEFVCLECGITKNRQNTMFYHMKKHTGEMNHICSEPGCGKAFIQKSGLQQHVAQMHTPEGTLWACPCCAHTCKMKANLVIHIGRKHGAGWIPAIGDSGCTGCKKQFTSATAYFYHAVQCFMPKAPDDLADKIAAAFHEDKSSDLDKSKVPVSEAVITTNTDTLIAPNTDTLIAPNTDTLIAPNTDTPKSVTIHVMYQVHAVTLCA